VSVCLSAHPSRCHTRALCSNVWTYLHAVSATWYSPIFIVCGPPQGIGVPKTGRVQMIPILSNNRLYLTNGTTYQARRQWGGVRWVRLNPLPPFATEPVGWMMMITSLSASTLLRIRTVCSARLWVTCNRRAVWLNVALLSRRSRQRQRLHATDVSICSTACLSPKCKKTRVSQKLSNLELRCPLTTYRKSHVGFLKNLLLTRETWCWRLNAKTPFTGKLSNSVSCK